MATKTLNQQFLITGYLEDITANTELDLAGSISSIAVKKDFVSDIMPLFVVNLYVDYSVREMLRKDSIRLAINVHEYDVPEDTSEIESNTPTANGLVFSTILKIFDKNLQEIDIKKDNDNDDTNVMQKFHVVLQCIPEDIYNRNSKIINTVYSKANNNEILLDILSDNNTNLYLDPSDNNNRDETLLIPPLNVSNAIEYLHKNHGVYNSNYCLFFDLDTTYMIKMFNENANISNKLIINVISQNETTSSTIYENYELDTETNNITKIMKTVPIVTSMKDVESNIIGGNVIIGSYGDKYELITRSYIYNPNDTKVRYYWNSARTDLFEQIQPKMPKEFSTLTLQNISPKYFGLRTKVEIHSNDATANGTYDIQSIRYVFGGTNFKNYSCDTVLYLAK